MIYICGCAPIFSHGNAIRFRGRFKRESIGTSDVKEPTTIMNKTLLAIGMMTFSLCSNAQHDPAALQARIDSLALETQTLKTENEKLRNELNAFMASERQVCPEDNADTATTGETVNASREDSVFSLPPDTAAPTVNAWPATTDAAGRNTKEEAGKGDATADDDGGTGDGDALQQLKKTTDNATGVTRYEYSKGIFSDGNQCSLYLTQRGFRVDVHINIVHTDDHPISFDSVSLSYDGNSVAVPFTSGDKNRKTSGSPKARKYREELDVMIDTTTVAFIRQMANASKAELLLDGRSTAKRQLSKRELRAFGIVLAAYDQITAGK